MSVVSEVTKSVSHWPLLSTLIRLMFAMRTGASARLASLTQRVGQHCNHRSNEWYFVDGEEEARKI